MPAKKNIVGTMVVLNNDENDPDLLVALHGSQRNLVQAGKKAPDFELPVAANGNGTINLDQLRGKTVLPAQFASW